MNRTLSIPLETVIRVARKLDWKDTDCGYHQGDFCPVGPLMEFSLWFTYKPGFLNDHYLLEITKTNIDTLARYDQSYSKFTNKEQYPAQLSLKNLYREIRQKEYWANLGPREKAICEFMSFFPPQHAQNRTKR